MKQTPCRYCHTKTNRTYKDVSGNLISSCKYCANKQNQDKKNPVLAISLIFKQY